MGIKQYKPTSAGRRAGMVSDFADCTYPRENRPEKSLLAPKKKKGGRNNQGITTSRFRGGGHKQRYRIIDFKRKRDNVEATVVQVEYDPNRSARIALIEYPKDEKFEFSRAYILAPDGLKAGDKVMSGETRGGRAEARQLHAAVEDAARHDHPQRRAGARQGRADVPLGRLQRHAPEPREGVGAAHPSERRSSQGAGQVPGDDRHACRTPST